MFGDMRERLIIKVRGYAYPDAEDCYWDGNWIACDVAAALPGFDASCKVAIRTEEFEAFLLGVDRLANARGGKARLQNMDDTIELSLQLDKTGRLAWTGRLKVPSGRHTMLSFGFLAARESLPELLREVRGVLDAYPHRGRVAATTTS